MTASMFFLAAGAHMLAGGALPYPGIVVGLVALTLAPVMILTRVKLTAPAMVALLGASQLALHEAFASLSVAGNFAPVSGQHLQNPALELPSAAAMMPGHAAEPGVPMLVLHAAATLVTALVLARGEAALWALAAWLRPLIRLLIALVIHPRPHLVAPAVVFIPSRWRNLRLPSLRGPPRVPAVL
ncbi:MAG: hypothetical protein ACXVYB_08495 [Arthrobacter sp.]